MQTLDNPITRQEMYLSYLNGNTDIKLPKPITRIERYLYALCMNGGGSGGGGEGTNNYNNLLNLPSIEDVMLKGNITLEDLGIQPDGETIVQELDGKIHAVVDAKIDSIKVNGEVQPIEDKSVDIKVTTKTSELENDSGFLKAYTSGGVDSGDSVELFDFTDEPSSSFVLFLNGVKQGRPQTLPIYIINVRQKGNSLQAYGIATNSDFVNITSNENMCILNNVDTGGLYLNYALYKIGSII